MAKGITTVVWIVVVIIIMLVAVLVILSMFGGGITQVASLTEARNICIQQFTTNCMATGTAPPTWSMPTIRVGTEAVSCASQVTCSCENKVASCG